MADQLKPMDYADIGEVLAEAIKDPDFRQKLVDSPEDALKDRGFKPGPATTEFFKSLKQGGFGQAADKLKSQRDSLGGAADM